MTIKSIFRAHLYKPNQTLYTHHVYIAVTHLVCVCMCVCGLKEGRVGITVTYVTASCLMAVWEFTF